jgi:hypothetical protein
MIGGDENATNRVRPLFAALAPAPDKGWGEVLGQTGGGYATAVRWPRRQVRVTLEEEIDAFACFQTNDRSGQPRRTTRLALGRSTARRQSD